MTTRHHLARRAGAVYGGDLPHQPDRFPEVKAAADTLYAELLAAGVDVMLDDRNERPGAMFADWELIGVPHRVTIGDRALKEGQVEYQHRRDAAATSGGRCRHTGYVAGQSTGLSGCATTWIQCSRCQSGRWRLPHLSPPCQS
jgi:hypothetical protein